MYDIREKEILSKIEEIANNYPVTFTVYAYIPKRKRVKYNPNMYKMTLVHEQAKVFSTPNVDELKKVFEEYKDFKPSVEVKIWFYGREDKAN